QQLKVVDNQQIKPPLAFQPTGARRQLAHGEAARLIDIERQVLQVDRNVSDLLEIAFVYVAAADLVRWNSGLFRNDAGGQLFGRHFQRKEADDAAIDGRHVAVGPNLAAPCLGDVIGNVGGERGFTHAGSASKDDQVRGLQPAHLAVEIGQAGCQTGKAAVALVGARGHVDGCRQRLRETLKTRVV